MYGCAAMTEACTDKNKAFQRAIVCMKKKMMIGISDNCRSTIIVD